MVKALGKTKTGSKARREQKKVEGIDGLYRRVDNVSGTVTFWFLKMVNGRKFNINFGEVTEDRARDMATQALLDIKADKDPTERKTTGGMTFERYAAAWLQTRVDEGKIRPASEKKYRATIDHCIEYLTVTKQTNKPIKTVTFNGNKESNTASYLGYRNTQPIYRNGNKNGEILTNGAAKKTLHTELSTLRKIFQDAIQDGYLEKNPFTAIRVARPKLDEVQAAHNPLLHIEQVKALLNGCRKVDAGRNDEGDFQFTDVVTLTLYTGLRLGEVENLTWDSVDLKNKQLNIITREIAETRKIPVSQAVLDALKEWTNGKRPNNKVFKSEQDAKAFPMRISALRSYKEMTALKVEDIDFENGFINWRDTYTWTPKGSNKPVPMCGIVFDLLERLHKTHTSNFVFPGKDGGKLRIKLLPLLKTACGFAGITDKFRFHDLRHTYAARLRQEGVDLGVLKDLMRHANIQETEIYAHYFKKHAVDAISIYDADKLDDTK